MRTWNRVVTGPLVAAVLLAGSLADASVVSESGQHTVSSGVGGDLVEALWPDDVESQPYVGSEIQLLVSSIREKNSGIRDHVRHSVETLVQDRLSEALVLPDALKRLMDPDGPGMGHNPLHDTIVRSVLSRIDDRFAARRAAFERCAVPAGASFCPWDAAPVAPASVPIPAAAVLFGSGLVGLVGVALRRRGQP